MALEVQPKPKTKFTFTHEKKTWELPLRFFDSEETEKLLTLYHLIRQIDTTEWIFSHTNRDLKKTGKGVLALSDAIIKTGK